MIWLAAGSVIWTGWVDPRDVYRGGDGVALDRLVLDHAPRVVLAVDPLMEARGST